MTAASDLVSRLHARGARRVAIQAPEGLKRRIGDLAETLEGAGFEVILSGDPCYGACDLALDLCDPGWADVLVHLGHAPVDGDAEPVIFDLCPSDIDVTILASVLPHLTRRRIGLVTTVQHAHQVREMQAFFAQEGIDAVVCRGCGRTPLPGQVLGCSFAAAEKTGTDELVVVATGVFHAIGVALSTGARVLAVDPVAGEVTVPDVDRMLRRRFALIEKARSARRIGIIVSTKSGQARIALARRLASLTPGAFLVAMREVDPDQLLNLGFGAYVNTACPRLAYDDQRRFPVPVLSPPEFEILCGVRDWADYQIDTYETAAP
ncbi:MAG: diphthamide biosynthesis enzyme Dph2 [Methanomicrobiales archaeon]